MSEMPHLIDRTIFLAFARSGSSIAFGCLQRMYAGSGLSAFDLVAKETIQSVSYVNEESLSAALEQHELVGCFRSPPPLLEDPQFNLKYVMLVRDPRDCFISWFHAAHLHDGVEKHRDFEKFLHAPDRIMKQSLKTFRFARKHGAHIIRYEDIYRDPALLFSKMIEIDTTHHFNREAIDSALIQLAMSQMVISDYTHNRSGEPYQAIRFQPKEVLDVLNERFSDVIDALGYPKHIDEIRDYPFRKRLEIDAIKRYCILLAEQNHLRMVENGNLYREIEDLKKAMARKSGWLAKLFRR